MSEVRDEVDECVDHVKARLEAYGFGQVPGIDRGELQRRHRLALAVIGAMMVTMALAQWGSGQPIRTIVVRELFIMIELPVLFIGVAHVYDYVLRKRMSPLQSLLMSGATSTSIAMTLAAVFYFVGALVPVFRAAFPGDMANSFFAVMIAAFGLGIMHLGIFALAFVYPFAAHDARVRALEADRLRTAAELARLRGHLEPHFLLNTLNAIAGLVTEDPREARRLLAALGDLLRDALRDGDEMHTLEQEEAFLRKYAEILESRHKGSLSFKWELDADVRTAPVPRLLLQPLVENAVKHGALRRRGGGTVTLRASLVPRASIDGPDVLECTVVDDGPGFAEGPIRQGAIGLSVVRRRLELKFQHATLRIESSTEGTRAIVAFEIPARPEAVPVRNARTVPRGATA
jgi:two-component sensor histidine kinase